MVEVALVKLATLPARLPMERIEPGEVVPMPRKPLEERRMPSVRSPLLSEENARSALAPPTVAQVSWVTMEVMAAVLVAVATVVDESDEKSICAAVEVALPGLETMSEVAVPPE